MLLQLLNFKKTEPKVPHFVAEAYIRVSQASLFDKTFDCFNQNDKILIARAFQCSSHSYQAGLEVIIDLKKVHLK